MNVSFQSIRSVASRLISRLDRMTDSAYSFLESHQVLVIAGFVLAHLLSKSLFLDGKSLWLDETFGIYHGQRSIPDIIRISNEGYSAPLYFILLKGWMAVSGISVAATRFLSVIFCSLTAVPLFYLARKHLNIQTAFFASLLFLVSAQQFEFAQQVRPYALVGLLSVISYSLFLDLLRSGKWYLTISLGIVNTGILYVHYFGGWVLVVQFITALLYWRRDQLIVKRYLLGQLIPVLLFLPSLKLLLWKAKSFYMVWLSVPQMTDIKIALAELAGSQQLLTVYCLLLITGSGFMVYHYVQASGKIDIKKLVLLLLWSFLPILALFLISVLYKPMFLLRFVLYAYFGMALLIAYWLSMIRISIFIRTVLMLLLVYQTAIMLPVDPQDTEAWQKAVKKVKSEKTNESAVILSPFYYLPSLTYYYDQEAFKDYVNTKSLLEKDKIIGINTAAEIPGLVFQVTNKFILVKASQHVVDPENSLFKYFDQHYKLLSTNSYVGILVSVFEPDRKDRPGEKVTYDLEQPASGWTISGARHKDRARSGTYASRISAANPYSVTYRAKMDSLALNKRIWLSVSVHGLLESENSGASLVVSCQRGENIYYYEGVNFKHFTGRLNEWTEIRFAGLLPKRKGPEDTVLIYVWSENKGITYVDDFQINFEFFE